MSQRPIILLVEDGPDERELFTLALEAEGLDGALEVACDGAEALERLLGASARPASDAQAQPAAQVPDARLASTSPPLPAVVVLDLDLPCVPGVEVLRRLRGDARTRTLPVVVLTTSERAEDLATCYALGANSFVRKAIGAEDFTTTIRVLARYWLQINRLPPSGTP